MSFFNSKNKTEHKLIVSLKSSSIDFQFIKKEKNHRTVLFSKRKIILLENSQNPELYTNQYIKELTNMLNEHRVEIQKKGDTSCIEVDLILYAPWFTSKIYSITHPGPAIINKNFLQSSITDIEKNTKLKIIEKRVIKIEVNGYILNDFIKTKSTNIKIDLYSSSIAKNIFQKLEETIKTSLPVCSTVNVFSSSLLYLDRIKEYMVKEDNITHVFIGGEITEISIIKDDSLVYTSTFPIGKHDFLRELQSSIQSYDYDLLYQKEIQTKSKKQETQFTNLKINWKESLKNSLENYQKQIPSKILITTDQKTKKFFTELLSETIHSDEISVLKNHRIISFDISSLKDIITYKTSIHEQEIDLILEALT